MSDMDDTIRRMLSEWVLEDGPVFWHPDGTPISAREMLELDSTSEVWASYRSAIIRGACRSVKARARARVES